MKKESMQERTTNFSGRGFKNEKKTCIPNLQKSLHQLPLCDTILATILYFNLF